MSVNVGESYNEQILQSIIDGSQYVNENPYPSRIEQLLMQLKEVIEQGGGKGSLAPDYENWEWINQYLDYTSDEPKYTAPEDGWIVLNASMELQDIPQDEWESDEPEGNGGFDEKIQLYSADWDLDEVDPVVMCRTVANDWSVAGNYFRNGGRISAQFPVRKGDIIESTYKLRGIFMYFVPMK